MTLIDTNVLLDLVTDDSNWADWSVAQLEAASLNGPLLINDAVYAELAVRYARIEDLDAFLDAAGLEMAPMPRAALFLAGKVFTQYRRSEGQKTGVLPDFFIGAHAAVGHLPLLTRDIGRYRTYFPFLKLITPGS
ncbi:type II toxin-antitoxin system VapC family toxin [Mesorhizobium sp. CA18]|uniref:type II toxin-antitoxin system VapC family toxin n=1 Tax=unclassified Mesorhizobium TaxID=325217 RepID=UPI001CCECB4E|nr:MULTISPECIES: type II toxin-antitoxin system VapC family toxin [unclassified Mesorhizobium]MBZ9735435.1 type II toxin-antitoxin system VapC family toxin [Mesorhizobium sp. CA9]MBZ9828212.1 type II toxin-antitoxin system VapC family toxin [Mesorhizobium sp. CA18]MBZ9831662.1 type II toxin-antitoxin system VapC family toxin [Mesorhizobium sp. CA2]MBZ9840218.1 type II toxin-antitoxin system VapC family toxin [Mesorhizobium sp. CA3]MBZ9878825.1 type II toxin-antitoxin system VapC family toxin [